MNISRIFASAVVRRLAYVAVALVFAAVASLLGMGTARAQSIEGCVTHTSGNSASCQTGEQAKAWADSWPRPAHCGSARDPMWSVSHAAGSKRFNVVETYVNGGCGQGSGYQRIAAFASYQQLCPADGSWNEETQSCYACDINAPPLGPGHMQCAGSGFDSCSYTVCSGGCGYDQPGGGHDGYVIDGRMWVLTTGWMPRGQTCTVGPTPGLGTPPTDSDGDGTSDGNDGSPNNPGSGGGGGEGGEGQPEDGSSPCGGPGQPACAEDGSNEGSGKGNTSGGGGNCQTPPSSTGDAILAQIAYQAWATRCAVEAQGVGGPVTGPGEGDGDQPGWTEGNGPANPEDTSAQDIDDASDWGIGLSADLLDTENIFGNASCPALPSFSIMGYEIDTSAFSWWCTLISIMRAAILIMGAFTAIQILLRGF